MNSMGKGCLFTGFTQVIHRNKNVTDLALFGGKMVDCMYEVNRMKIIRRWG